MAAKNKPGAGKFPAREVVITRICNAPRELVFRAWTEPQQLARWWGPKSFTNPVCEVDARPGGAWRIVMRGPDGGEYPCHGVYQEIVAPERLVFTNDAVDADGRDLIKGITTVIFEALGDKTKVTLRTRATPMSALAAQMIEGMKEGWTQSLEKLESDTDRENPVPSDRELVSTRLYAAPRELVYQMWIDRDHVGKWWGPKGFSLTIDTMEVRPGGVWQFVMHGPDRVDYPNKKIYAVIAKPERLVFDHVSNPTHRMDVTFMAEGAQTRVTARLTFPSAAVREQTVQKYDAAEGLKQTLGRLGDLLATR